MKVAAELAVMRHLSVGAFPDYDEVMVRVSQESAIRIKRNSYSVPTRLIGEQVRVRVSSCTWRSGMGSSRC